MTFLPKNTLNWFKQAFRFRGRSAKNFNVQFGVHVEEFKEMLESIKALESDEPGFQGMTTLAATISDLKALSTALKTGQVRITEVDHKELLDAIVDQQVTGTGVAYQANYDLEEGVKRVDASNWSKFVDGEAIWNGDKIGKGPDHKKPDLTDCVANATKLEY